MASRQSKKEKQKQNYLDGVARKPHVHTRTLRKSLEGAGPSQPGPSGASQLASVCPQCYPVLSRYKDVFKSMKHSGTDLKKRKKSNPYPKHRYKIKGDW